MLIFKWRDISQHSCVISILKLSTELTIMRYKPVLYYTGYLYRCDRINKNTLNVKFGGGSGVSFNTSEYSGNDKKEAKSRSRTHSFFNEETDWKFRDIYQQDNDIDGEIEVFDVHKGQNPQTMAKFIKVQLKSTDNPEINIEKQEIVYEATAKFVRFCFLCDQPVILLVHDIPGKKAYYLWMQRHIFEVLEKDNPTWRENTSSVTLRFSASNQLCIENLPELKSIAVNGTQQILKMRETSSYKKNYDKVQKSISKGGVYLAKVGERITPVYVAGILNPREVFVAPLTSNVFRKRTEMDVFLEKEKITLLPKDSIISLINLTILDRKELLDYFGRVPHDIFYTVSEKVKSLF